MSKGEMRCMALALRGAARATRTVGGTPAMAGGEGWVGAGARRRVCIASASARRWSGPVLPLSTSTRSSSNSSPKLHALLPAPRAGLVLQPGSLHTQSLAPAARSFHTTLTQADAECCPPQAPRPQVAHPVAATGEYELRGSYESLGGFDKVYVTGPDAADHAIVVIYDIFGFWETTQRGSDLLVSHLLLTSPHKAYMPDVFRGHPFPPEKDGDKVELGKFFNGTAKIEDRLPEVLKFAQFLKTERKFKTVSILGYCWGGKITLLALGSPNSPFSSGATCHPAMIANGDGDALARPLAFYPSKDEPADVAAYIEQTIKTKPFASQCDFHLYNTVHHGWAAARADLSNPENRKQFDDVYQRLADFFSKVDRA